MREDIREYNAVENVARKFIEAVKSGKSEIMKPYFHEKAVIFGQYKDTVQAGPIQQLYDVVDENGACTEDYCARIDILALEPTVAVVKVVEDNWNGCNFLTILKINGEWKVVAKAYDTLAE